MNDNPQGPQPFNVARAVEYGKLVNIAYAMCVNENDLTPPCPQLPSGFEFVAWVQMRDFIFNSTTLRFYGLIVHRVGTPDQYILAIRGTIASNLEEWVDNLTSVEGVPVPNFGNVGYGFQRIFETMQVIKKSETKPTDEFGNALTAHKPFEWQVAEAVQSHAAKVANAKAMPPAEAISVEVTGHSLGSALATLYVAKNANAKLVHVPRIYTFASPLVGNAVFVAAFAKLNVDSWRIANSQDLVPHVPKVDLKNAELFEHVTQEHPFDSADEVNKTLGCLHSMITYLHFVDPDHWLLDEWCAWVESEDVGPNIGGHTPA